MWAILSPGSGHVSKSSQFQVPQHFPQLGKGKPGMLLGQQSQHDKSRSRSLPPGRQDPGLLDPQVHPSDGFEGDRDQLVPARKDPSLHTHVLHLEERLERGAQEVQALRLRNEHACREAAAAQSNLAHLQHQVHELQSRNAAHEQDSRSLAALRQALHQQQQHLSAELASTDAKGQLTAQEGRNAISILQGLIQQLQTSLSTEKVTAEQVCVCSIGAVVKLWCAPSQHLWRSGTTQP